MQAALIQQLRQSLQLPVSETVSEEELLQALTQRVNQLLDTDFQALVQLLYRLDVPEEKLKQLLRQNPHTDAAHIIATLIIQRQQQKMESREQYKQQGNENTEEEHW